MLEGTLRGLKMAADLCSHLEMNRDNKAGTCMPDELFWTLPLVCCSFGAGDFLKAPGVAAIWGTQ